SLGRDIPVTYVPFRNAHFLAVDVSWAEVIGASKIYIGAVEQDSSGYPDCRPAYYEAFNKVIDAGTKSGGIEIVTPLIAMRKSEIVRLGLDLGAPFDLTWSCYSREDRACGLCDSCVLRLRRFERRGPPIRFPIFQRRSWYKFQCPLRGPPCPVLRADWPGGLNEAQSSFHYSICNFLCTRN